MSSTLLQQAAVELVPDASHCMPTVRWAARPCARIAPNISELMSPACFLRRNARLLRGLTRSSSDGGFLESRLEPSGGHDTVYSLTYIQQGRARRVGSISGLLEQIRWRWAIKCYLSGLGWENYLVEITARSKNYTD